MVLRLGLFFPLLFGLTIQEKPNIIVIIADDMGFNDVGFHGSDEIPTPNIDALAYSGVILNSHYTQSLCTPSRAAFLTGKYPIHTGMQHLVILEPEPWGLPLNETLMPQLLKQNGYATHAVGKWHLGFFEKEYTPTYRGFDSHYGYWQGYHDYYTHMTKSTFSDELGYDMRRNMEVDYDAKGKYSTTLFTNEAVRLIQNHDTAKPMFLYMAHLAPHSGIDSNPLQAPDEEIAKFANIEDPERRIYAAMVSMLDQSVGSVVTALRDKQMLENSIILFISDNGAQPEGTHANHGSNYPFRGTKESAWEGGTRNIAAIWSPLIKNSQRVSNHLMHITDWLPTLYSAAGLNKSQISKIDGLDLWESISEDKDSPRTEMLYNIDDIQRWGGIRQGDWKYVYGSASNGKLDKWFGDSGQKPEYTYDVNQVLSSKVATAFMGLLTQRQIQEKKLRRKRREIKLLDRDIIKTLRDNARIICENVDEENQLEKNKCNLLQSQCLFNIRNDPCERVNLATDHPNIVTNLEYLLVEYRKTALPPRNKPSDVRANPARWNNTWSNWNDCHNILHLKMKKNLTIMNVGVIVGSCVIILLMIFGLSKLADIEKKKEQKQALLRNNGA